ncbi:MAG TPA: hypothetical protein VFN87_22105, partial [Solirubrobacteraceae bacterium]|nr:hypothetical protein [Solirubrobacteraceae bacterium]
MTLLISDTRTRILSPAPRAEWLAVYESDPNALIYHHPAWVDLMCAFAGFQDASRLYELPGDRYAVLPMVRRQLLGAPLWEASFPPAWGQGGLLASGGVGPGDLAVMFEDLRRRRVPRISLRPNPLSIPAWEEARPAGVITVPR